MNNSKFLNILVGLDLTEMDEALVRYLEIANHYFNIKEVVFLHNLKVSELPEELQESAMLEKISIGIKGRLQKLIQENLKVKLEYSVVVTQEAYSELAFMDISKQSKTDLTILGNKQKLLGAGGLPQKLVRMLKHATILVPETFNEKAQIIVEAIDFSKFSPAVHEIGQEIVNNYDKEDELVLKPVYVSKIPLKMFPGPSRDEIISMFEKDAESKRKKWNKQFSSKQDLLIIQAKEKSIASALSEFINKNRVDLVIMGVKGTTSLTNLFLGSVANELIQIETNACILLTKREHIKHTMSDTM